MHQQLIRLAAITLLTLTWSGCTQYERYRTKTLGYDDTPAKGVVPMVANCFSGRAQGTLPPCEDKEGVASGEYAVQHRHYEYKDYKQDGNWEPRSADYHLTFVEFDDQGWFADRKQMEALFMLLHRLETEEKRSGNEGHLLIFLYAHGWKHNASQCDNNVICFSRLLERMDILERHLEENIKDRSSPRRVVGVYVGWRGLSVKGGVLSNITFWTRKSTAERVGRGGVTELLTRLNDYRRARNPNREEDKTQLVIAGHSFGGQVIYSALSHALMERAGRIDRFADVRSCEEVKEPKYDPNGLTCYETATSFGDFVVLVNPAFEGSQYEPLFHIATNRCYSPQQRPVMMTVTSAGDQATGIAFPFGRKVGTLLEHAASPEQADSIIEAVGHDARYETHKLKWMRPTGMTAAEREPAPQERDCGCPYLEPTTEFNWREFARPLKPYLVATTERRSSGPVPARKELGARVYDLYAADTLLVGDTKYGANYPYLVVKTDPEIIPDHNSIYSEPFMRFLHSFFLVHIANGRPFEADGCWKARDVEACPLDSLIPCEQSCRLPDGRSCSGRSTKELAAPP